MREVSGHLYDDADEYDDDLEHYDEEEDVVDPRALDSRLHEQV